MGRTPFALLSTSSPLFYHRWFTLLSCSSASTSSELSTEEQASAGISPGLVRMSVGYTGSLEQRWDQLLDGLRAVGVVA